MTYIRFLYFSHLQQEIGNSTLILKLFSQFITFHEELGCFSFEHDALSVANLKLRDLEDKFNIMSSSFGEESIIVKKLRLRFESTHKCLELLSTIFDMKLEKR